MTRIYWPYHRTCTTSEAVGLLLGSRLRHCWISSFISGWPGMVGATGATLWEMSCTYHSRQMWGCNDLVPVKVFSDNSGAGFWWLSYNSHAMCCCLQWNLECVKHAPLPWHKLTGFFQRSAGTEVAQHHHMVLQNFLSDVSDHMQKVVVNNVVVVEELFNFCYQSDPYCT